MSAFNEEQNIELKAEISVLRNIVNNNDLMPADLHQRITAEVALITAEHDRLDALEYGDA